MEFVGIINYSIIYLIKSGGLPGIPSGDDVVRDLGLLETCLLYTSAEVFYAPLVEEIKARGLVAMKEKIEHDYNEEEVPEDCHTELTEDRLTVVIDKCPAVSHIKASGDTPCKWFKNTTSTVYGKIASLTGYAFSMDYYCEETGATKYHFYKRGAKK